MRNYKKEYSNYHSKPDQKKKRASRNTARARMIKSGSVKKRGDKKDVTHRNGNPKDNKKKNLGVAKDQQTDLMQELEQQRK